MQLKMAGRAICDLQDKRQADMEVFEPQIAAQGRFSVSLHKTIEQLHALLAAPNEHRSDWPPLVDVSEDVTLAGRPKSVEISFDIFKVSGP